MFPAPHHHPLLRRGTLVLEKVIHARRSFKDLSARADKLELGKGNSSSAEAIATFFSSKPQEAIEARLREQQQVPRFSSRHLIHLLRFSAYCSWRSSLICGSLFQNILEAKCSLDRVEIILNSPACRSQVRDLLLALADLHNLFSEDTLATIRHAKLLLKDLLCDLKRYEEKTRVRALSRMSAVKRRAKSGILRCKPVVRHLSSKLITCSGSDSHQGGVSVHDDADGADSVADENSVKVGSSNGKGSDRKNAFSSLHKVHVRLHQIEASMQAVSFTFDTLMPLLSGTHNQSLSEHLINILRDDPLMFDGIATQITDCNSRLSKHLEDVREQVLICFCYINNARDLAYAI